MRYKKSLHLTTDDSVVIRSIHDYTGLSWSTHYGISGGGFGYLKFTLPRMIGTNYNDIGFGYEVTLFKSLSKVLFHGQIRQIEEVSDPKGDKINITALGWNIVADDDRDTLFRAFCDKRLSMWKTSSEVPAGSFRPDLFGFGSNTLGLYFNASTNETSPNDYIEVAYDFTGDSEIAERVKVDLSTVLGSGVVFSGNVASISTDDVYYNDYGGASEVTVDMTIYNQTRNASSVVTAVGSGYFTVTTGSASTWVAGDELIVYGPFFSGRISNISGAIITYADDIGEANLAANQVLADIAQKSIATIQSVDTGANTITVTDDDHIAGWAINDAISVGAPLFSATISGSPAGAVITYTGPVGESIVESTAGWVLYNITREEYATVQSWATGSNQVTVGDSGDISAWVNTDEIAVYSPYAISIIDSENATVWPTDWREGAIPHDRTAVDELTTGSPTGLKLRFKSYLGGTGNEMSFSQLSNLRAYSTEDAVTAEMLSKYLVGILSVAGHDLSSSTYDIEAVAYEIEPMVYEFVTPKAAISQACAFGGGSGILLAWGIRLNNSKTFYLETQDLETIGYKITRAAPITASMSGDIQSAYQRVRAIYTDKLGRQVTTDWQADTDAYFSGRYRSITIRLDNVDTEAEADNLVALYLNENKYAKRAAAYSAQNGSIFTVGGIAVPFDEVQATGQIIEIEDWRAVETGASGADIGQYWAKEQLVATETDYDSGKVKLIPASAKATFTTYMSNLARLAQL